MVSPWKILDVAENNVEACFKTNKKFIPHIARLFLVSTFIDDGVRMITYWQEQENFFQSMYPYPVVIIILIINCVVQLASAALVLARKHSQKAVFALFFVVGFQTILYSLIWSPQFMARNLALVGSLVLLLADSRNHKKSDYAGVPSLSNTDQTTSYMQLAGRLLLMLMFFTLVHPDMSSVRWGVTLADMALIICVAVGFKAKLAAFFLLVILFGFNFIMNDFWAVPSWQYDYVKYDFFQTLSVIGGLLMIAYLGAGDISIDERKKLY